MTTTFPKPLEIERKWHVVDATNQPLGRLAVRVANVIRGKTKPAFTPHIDTGDFVIVVNAEKVKLTGAKEDQKIYKKYTGFTGGLKEVPARKIRATRPTLMVEQAVRGMLPKNRLGRQLGGKLYVYAGPDHPHAAQQPEPLSL